MAVRAENLCFENMGFGSFAMGGSQDWVMGSVFERGDGFCFQEFQPVDEQRKELHPFLDYSENLPSSSSSSSSPFSCSVSLPMDFLQSLFSDLEKQKLEMDLFLQFENQRLMKSILEEERRQQAILMEKYESRMRNFLLQRDEELKTARNKTLELQDLLKRAETEARAWEKKAKEKESIVFDLHNRLNRARDVVHEDDDDDAVSFCDSSSSKDEKKLPLQHSKKNCKLCQAREMCVVFFPCRHLCVCKSCEGLFGHCPVCGAVKEVSLEVFLV